MEAIGDKIKRLRKNRGLSLMDLANILEVSDTALSKIETGKTKSITIDLGKGIAKALGISFGELFDIEDSGDAAELLSLKNEEFDNLNKQLNEKSLLIELLLKEKYNDKLILMNSITRYSNQVLSFLQTNMKNASNDNERNIFERLIEHELKNKQVMFDNLIVLGVVTQKDLDNYNKEREEIYGVFGKTPN